MKKERASCLLETSERGFRWCLHVARFDKHGAWGGCMYSAWKESPDHAWEDLLWRMKAGTAQEKPLSPAETLG